MESNAVRRMTNIKRVALFFFSFFLCFNTAVDNKAACVYGFLGWGWFLYFFPRKHAGERVQIKRQCASIKYPALWSPRLERCCSPFHSQCGAPLSFGSNQRSSPCIRFTSSPRAHSTSETWRSDSWLICTLVSYAFASSSPRPQEKKDWKWNKFWYTEEAAVCVCVFYTDCRLSSGCCLWKVASIFFFNFNSISFMQINPWLCMS